MPSATSDDPHPGQMLPTRRSAPRSAEDGTLRLIPCTRYGFSLGKSLGKRSSWIHSLISLPNISIPLPQPYKIWRQHFLPPVVRGEVLAHLLVEIHAETQHAVLRIEPV